MLKKYLFLIIIFFFTYLSFTYFKSNDDKILIAIANYGPHDSLYQTIKHTKLELEKLGYKEGENIIYKISDANFDTSLIVQILANLKSLKPDIIVAISTPVAQIAKNMIKDIPIIYANVTDPESAGLSNGQGNITGVSDKQDLSFIFDLADRILKKTNIVGVLYSENEDNDVSMIRDIKRLTLMRNMHLIKVPIKHLSDVSIKMEMLRSKVDFIYTGSSGIIQSAFPAISNIAKSMNIPLLNFNEEQVILHQALASYGISYRSIGKKVAKIIHEHLNGESLRDIEPIYPNKNDHKAFISKKRADEASLEIIDIDNVSIID